MAEAIGLVASILALAGAGAKLGMTLYTIADGVGSAGREARLIADEVSFFSHALTALSKSLERTTSQTARLHGIARELVGSCRTVLVELSALAEELSLSKKERRKHKISSMVARIKWMLQKPKVAFLRSSISSFKSTLTLLVASMDYTEAVDRHAPDAIREQLRAQVESLAETGKAASHALMESHRLLEAVPAPSRHQEVKEPLLIDFGPSDETQLTILPSGASTPTSVRVEELSDSEEETLPELTLSINHSIHAQRLVSALAHDILHHQDDHETHWTWYNRSSAEATMRAGADRMSDGHGLADRSHPRLWAARAQDAMSKASTESPFKYQTGFGDPPDMQEVPEPVEVAQDSGYGTSKASVDELSPEQAGDFKRLERLEAKIADLAKGSAVPGPDDRITGLEQKLQTLLDMQQTSAPKSPQTEDMQYIQVLENRVAELQAESERRLRRNPRAATPSQNNRQHDWTAGDLQGTVEELVQQYLEASGDFKKTREREQLQAIVEEYKQEQAAKEAAALERARQEQAARDEALSAKRAAEERDSVRRANAELEKKLRELHAEMEKMRPPPDSLKAPIRFKDAVGRKFSFPWHLVKTWKGMEILIKQAFLHVDVIGEHVNQGHYDLTGPDGEILLPQVWDTMIQPDWEISMHMWPMPEHMDKDTRPPEPMFPDGFFHDSSNTRQKPQRGQAPTPGPPPADLGIPTISDDFSFGMPQAAIRSKKSSAARPKGKKSTSGFSQWIAGGQQLRKVQRPKKTTEKEPPSEGEETAFEANKKLDTHKGPSPNKTEDEDTHNVSDVENYGSETDSEVVATVDRVEMHDLRPTVEDVVEVVSDEQDGLAAHKPVYDS